MLSIAICEDNVPVQSQLENYIHELFSSCPVEMTPIIRRRFAGWRSCISIRESRKRWRSCFAVRWA